MKIPEHIEKMIDNASSEYGRRIPGLPMNVLQKQDFTVGAQFGFNLAQKEIDRLNRIIAKELSENDELGAEFVYVNALKTQIKELQGQLEEALKIQEKHHTGWFKKRVFEFRGKLGE